MFAEPIISLKDIFHLLKRIMMKLLDILGLEVIKHTNIIQQEEDRQLQQVA